MFKNDAAIVVYFLLCFSWSLNTTRRQRDMLRVTHENQAILKRIQSKEPHYNHMQWVSVDDSNNFDVIINSLTLTNSLTSGRWTKAIWLTFRSTTTLGCTMKNWYGGVMNMVMCIMHVHPTVHNYYVHVLFNVLYTHMHSMHNHSYCYNKVVRQNWGAWDAWSNAPQYYYCLTTILLAHNPFHHQPTLWSPTPLP